MNGLHETVQKLELRRQSVKLLMYKRLQWLLLSTLPLIITLMVINLVNISNRNDLGWVSRNWDFFWFYTDGFTHLIFFYVFSVIIFLWRPTTDNARYGLEELPSDEQDDEEEREQVFDSEAFGNIKLRNIHRADQSGARSRNSNSNVEVSFVSPVLDGPHDIGNAEDDLKWVEENIGKISNDDGDDGDDSRLVVEELSKMT